MMLGISLPIAATAVLLVQAQIIDVQPVPAETGIVTLRCGPLDSNYGRTISFNPATRVVYDGAFPYKTRSRINSDAGHFYIKRVFEYPPAVMRIDRETMTYVVMRDKKRDDELLYERLTEIGVCRVLP